MGRVWRAAAVATSLGLGGCLVVNGAFQASEGDGSGNTGTTVVTGGDASTSTTDATTSSSSTGPDPCAGSESDLCVPQSIGGQPYLLCYRYQTWEESLLACEARCARLAVLDAAKSAALFTELRSQMTDADKQQEADGGEQYTMPSASWWIGGHKVDGAYQWLDGTPMPPMSTGGWHPNDPNIDDPNACVVLGVFGLGENNGTWLDRLCVDVPYRSICEPL